MNKIIGTLCFFLAATMAVVGYLLLKNKQGKHGYVVNEIVFEKFAGKIKLEDALREVETKHRNALDSLESAVASGTTESVAVYQHLREQYAQDEQRLSAQYTEDIWKEINQQIVAFGKEQGYDFIYGATGNGSLMYGSEAFDISEEVVDYINAKYEGEK
ncbi:MAG TPA: OmpH family outer membrane protein [Ohtaekwangia sp.]